MVNKKNIWGLLDRIPDPEIPVISVVELGVVRDVKVKNKIAQIIVTPTYSGCPAMHQMKNDIRDCLNNENIKHEIVTKLSPAWTTDWMNNKTKEKLRKYGISPPEKNISCPQCNSKKIELISEFGSTACKSLYKCLTCLEPFDYFKCL